MPALVDRPQARVAKAVRSNYLSALEVAPLKTGWFGYLSRRAEPRPRCRTQRTMRQPESSALGCRRRRYCPFAPRLVCDSCFYFLALLMLIRTDTVCAESSALHTNLSGSKTITKGAATRQQSPAALFCANDSR